MLYGTTTNNGLTWTNQGMIPAGFNTMYFTQLYGGTAGNGDNQRLELGAQLPPGFMMIAPNGSQTPDKSLVQFGGRWGIGTCPEIRIFTLDDFIYHLDPSLDPSIASRYFSVDLKLPMRVRRGRRRKVARPQPMMEPNGKYLHLLRICRMQMAT